MIEIRTKSIKADIVRQAKDQNVLRLFINKGGFGGRKIVAIQITEQDKQNLLYGQI